MNELRKTLSAAEVAQAGKNELVNLVVELCRQFEGVRAFVQSRFCEAPINWYKKQVQFCVRPDVIDGDAFDFERGRSPYPKNLRRNRRDRLGVPRYSLRSCRACCT